MVRIQRLHVPLWATILCLLFSGGCAAPNYRTRPDAVNRSREIRSVALLSPDVRVYEVSAGGVSDERSEWSAQGKENTARAITEILHARGVVVKPVPAELEAMPEVRELKALFRAVLASVLSHTYNQGRNPNVFQDKVSNFDYSLGSLDDLLRRAGADALIIVTGQDEVSTGGQKTLTTLGIIAGAAAGALTGVVVMPRISGATMNLALADRDGNILWFSAEGSAGADLRDPASAAEFSAVALDGLPRLGP